jgi:hypothetical protein
MSRRRNRPRLTHFAGLLLVGRHDFRMPATRRGAVEMMPEFAQRASGGQIDSPQRGNWVFDQKAARPFGEFGKEEPVARPTHSATYSAGGGTELAGRMTNSRSPAPVALSVTLPSSNTTGCLTSLATNRSTPFAAETWFIAGAVAGYHDINSLTWVLVVLLVLVVGFICWPPPPGDVDTGPGCNGP